MVKIEWPFVWFGMMEINHKETAQKKHPILSILPHPYNMSPNTEFHVQISASNEGVRMQGFAKVAYAIGFFFNRCEIAVEYAREGMTTANELMNVLEYKYYI